MQQPTCTHMRVRNTRDAQVLLHAVALRVRPLIHRRLDDDERLALQAGDVYVWEERSANPLDAPSVESMQRFTDGRAWGPSKAREDFLMYWEKDEGRTSLMTRNNGLRPQRLIKQTYSAYVHAPGKPVRKWHLNAYYTTDTFDAFRCVDDFADLRAIRVPEGRYVCARTSAQRRTARAAAAGAAGEPAAREDAPAVQLVLPPGPSPSSPASSSSAGSAPPSPASLAATYPTAYQQYQQYQQYAYGGQYEEGQQHEYDGQQYGGAPVRLAPLAYLQSMPPPTRDPEDEEALRRLHPSRL